MSEQAMDLQSSAGALRRHVRLVAAGGVLGLLAGVGYVLTQPPHLTSTALVLVSVPPSDGQTGSDIKTQVRIATSASILSQAGRAVTPPLSASAMQRRTDVSAATPQIVQISAWAPRSRDAQTLAGALTNAYINYVRTAADTVQDTALSDLNDRKTRLQSSLDALQEEIDATKKRRNTEPANSQDGRRDAQLSAQLQAEQADVAYQLDKVEDQVTSGLPASTSTAARTSVTKVQEATTPVARSLIVPLSLWLPLGFLIGALLTSVPILLLARRDRRLRLRDEIADAVGSTVLISVRSRAPKSVPGWSALLESYAAGSVDQFAYRQMLRTLAPNDGQAGRSPLRPGRVEHPESLTVISFAGDRQALAFGPQLASFTASMGIQSRLITAVGNESAAELWTACAAARSSDVRPNLVVGEVRPAENAQLTVVLAVVDRRSPALGRTMRTQAVLLAVSAGAATEEDLARFAVAVDDAGGRLAGVAVVNPESTDRTTGRFTMAERGEHVPLPMRLPGSPTQRVVEGRWRSRP